MGCVRRCVCENEGVWSCDRTDLWRSLRVFSGVLVCIAVVVRLQKVPRSVCMSLSIIVCASMHASRRRLCQSRSAPKQSRERALVYETPPSILPSARSCSLSLSLAFSTFRRSTSRHERCFPSIRMLSYMQPARDSIYSALTKIASPLISCRGHLSGASASRPPPRTQPTGASPIGARQPTPPSTTRGAVGDHIRSHFCPLRVCQSRSRGGGPAAPSPPRALSHCGGAPVHCRACTRHSSLAYLVYVYCCAKAEDEFAL